MGLSINKQTNKQIAQVRFDAHFRSLSVNGGGGGGGGEEEEETTSSTSRTLTTIRTTTTRTTRRHRRRKAGGQGGSSRKQKVDLMPLILPCYKIYHSLRLQSLPPPPPPPAFDELGDQVKFAN